MTFEEWAPGLTTSELILARAAWENGYKQFKEFLAQHNEAAEYYEARKWLDINTNHTGTITYHDVGKWMVRYLRFRITNSIV